MTIIPFPLNRLNDLECENGAPLPERVVEGFPRFRTWMLAQQDDLKVYSGVWEATPGCWRISYDEWEFCSILSGVSEVCSVGAQAVRLAAGDHFVIQPGFAGTWRVIETTRKLFVVRLP